MLVLLSPLMRGECWRKQDKKEAEEKGPQKGPEREKAEESLQQGCNARDEFPSLLAGLSVFFPLLFFWAVFHPAVSEVSANRIMHLPYIFGKAKRECQNKRAKREKQKIRLYLE